VTDEGKTKTMTCACGREVQVKDDRVVAVTCWQCLHAQLNERKDETLSSPVQEKT
jgi:hypothetical protein